MEFFQTIAHKFATILAIFSLGGGVAVVKPAPLPVAASLVGSVTKPVDNKKTQTVDTPIPLENKKAESPKKEVKKPSPKITPIVVTNPVVVQPRSIQRFVMANHGINAQKDRILFVPRAAMLVANYPCRKIQVL